MLVKIEPVIFNPLHKTKKATSLRIDKVEISKFGEEGHAIVHYSLLDDNEAIVMESTFELTNDDYVEWGQDDDYLLKKTILYFGFVQQQ